MESSTFSGLSREASFDTSGPSESRPQGLDYSPPPWLSDRWIAQLQLNRVHVQRVPDATAIIVTRYDRDTDVILAGIGYRISMVVVPTGAVAVSNNPIIPINS